MTADAPSPTLPTTGCVVVHHRSPGTLVPTIASLVSAGIEPENLVVVDNSEDGSIDSISNDLQGAHCLATANDGYGAAVNAGVAWLHRERTGITQVLVSTHEVLVEPTTIAELLHGLEEPSVAAVGPVLFESLEPSAQIWSAGGTLTPRTLVARHRTTADATGERFVPADWLDGSIVLYRAAPLRELGFDETYFLYLEEVDLQLRLRRAGWHVRVASRARAVQSTNGMPAYWAMRNRVYFGRKFALGAAGWLGTGRVLAQLSRHAVRRRRAGVLRGVVRGLADGGRLQPLPPPRASGTPE